MPSSASCRIVLWLAAALPVLAQNAEPSVITSVRQWSFDNATRIAIEVSEETRFRLEELQNPDRLFIDIDGSECRINGKRFAQIPVGDKLVRQIRVAQSQPKVVRVVLDLETAVEYEISHLSAPHRLMIEVRPRKSLPAPMPSSIDQVIPTGTPVMTKPSAAVPVPASMTTSSAPALEPVVKTIPPPVATPPPSSAKPVPSPPASQSALPAKRTKEGNQTLTRTLGLKLARVVIDPGHGGHDDGTTGVTGLREKDLVLDVSRRLGALLEEKLGSQVIYTRSDDTFIPLEGRTAIANREKADLFLSIHANSSPAPEAYGTETYYLRFTSSKYELETAARENATTSKSVYELQDLVKQIALQEKVDESREFADRVQAALYKVWSRSGNPTRNRGLKKAPFVVLIGATMPCVLTELGFLSNPREESLLKKPDYRQKIAEALYRGIEQYVESLSHFSLAQATGK